MVHLSSSEDPFAFILAPPTDESPEEKEARECVETEARRVNDSIDEQLRQERMALKKKKKPVKVLLLGQSESGMSAFQPPQFPPDRAHSLGKSATLKSQRFIIHLGFDALTQSHAQIFNCSMLAMNGPRTGQPGAQSFL
jgi:hypothetical protein